MEALPHEVRPKSKRKNHNRGMPTRDEEDLLNGGATKPRGSPRAAQPQDFLEPRAGNEMPQGIPTNRTALEGAGRSGPTEPSSGGPSIADAPDQGHKNRTWEVTLRLYEVIDADLRHVS